MRPHGEPRDGEWPLEAMLDPEGERLVVELRAGLGRLAGSGGEQAVDVRASEKLVLDIAEFVLRRQLLAGQGERIPHLLPSFVYLLLQPRVGGPEALSVARASSSRLLQRV